eukprot:TRINITY_DN6727_c0_g1_i1.p1 TRINITY_DN6727_c0_g1~~TRINITY_DN6727_c0_g1_i1.p1  ORF type:complete len:182 (-),score=52.07 TRINITY_DN6727_c0_g1_i1:168-713(-)
MHQRTQSDPTLNSRLEVKKQIKELVKENVKSRTGPSFEERLQNAVMKKTAEMRNLEKEQHLRLQTAKEKGAKKSQNASPIAAFLRSGEAPNHLKQADRLEERRHKMAEEARKYKKYKDQLQERMRNREPLYRVSDVHSAQTALAEQAEKRKQELMAEERKRWAHIDEINRNVLNRPLLMDS